MIKLFVADIDGCLAEPYEAYDLEGVQTLARLASEAGGLHAHPGRPTVSLCSGRPYAYVEAVTQLLGLEAPVFFESGGGFFDLQKAEVTWNPAFTSEVEEAIIDVGNWLRTEVISDSVMFDHGKRTQRGVISKDQDAIADVAPRVRAYVEEQHPALCVYTTHISVDVLAEHITKQQALDWGANHFDIALDEVAYIGDTEGDLDALTSAGRSFAPANAHDVVRDAVDVVTEASHIQGTLEAYRACLRSNQHRMEAA